MANPVLEATYELECDRLQSGKFDTWLTVEELEVHLCASGKKLGRDEIVRQLRHLWTHRIILQVPLQCSSDYELQQARSSHYDEPLPAEQDDVRGPSRNPWKEVAVFSDSVSTKFRSRIAEITRLLNYNYQRYDMRPGTALTRYVPRRQTRPLFSLPIEEAATTLRSQVTARELIVGGQTFSLDGGVSTANLVRASDLVFQAVCRLFTKAGRSLRLAQFQFDALLHSVAGLYSAEYRKIADGHVITAGVGAGKTYAFQLGALVHVVYQSLKRPTKRPSVLFVYPRVMLAHNQIIELEQLVDELNALDSSLELKHPVLDAGGNLAKSGRGRRPRGALLSALNEHYKGPYQIFVSNLDTIVNRLVHPDAGIYLCEHVDLVVIDEAHLFSGIYGAHARAVIDRLVVQRATTRQRAKNFSVPFEDVIANVSQMSSKSRYKPYFVGASATIAEPRRHLARIVTSTPVRIRHVDVTASDAVLTGYVHHVFLRQRYQASSLSAATNAVSCLIHNRRDGLFNDYYTSADGQVARLENTGNPLNRVQIRPRNVRGMRKSLGFSNSLDAVNRWADLIADNEKTKKQSMYSGPQPKRFGWVPYFARFTEPLWRVVQLQSSSKNQPKWRAQIIEHYGALCRLCKQGVAKSIPRLPPQKAARANCQKLWDSSPGSQTYYLAQLGVKESDWQASQFTPVAEAQQSEEIGSLDRCGFFRSGLCWWWSEDSLGSNSTEAVSDQQPLNGLKKLVHDQPYVTLGGIRVATITSKKAMPNVLDSIDDIFAQSASFLLRLGGQPTADSENAALLIGSPRIEVGIDLSHVTEGFTYRAMRDPAGFQQKVGRVGREQGADSMLTHIVTENTREQYYLRNPELVLDSSFLQPVPLHENNMFVRRAHLYMAVFDFIVQQTHGPVAQQVAAGGERIFIINDSLAEPDSRSYIWDSKLGGFLDFLFGINRDANQNNLHTYLELLGATTEEVAEVLDALKRDFVELMQWRSPRGAARPYSVAKTIAAHSDDPEPAPKEAPLRVRSFVQQIPRPIYERSYLSQILTLPVFVADADEGRPKRRYIWPENLFQASGKSYVKVQSVASEEKVLYLDTETTQVALALLCPGTVTYRYHQTPDKVLVSASAETPHVVQAQRGILNAYLDVTDATLYEQDVATPLDEDDLPAGAPWWGEPVRVYRPLRILVKRGSSQPLATAAGLLADGDEGAEESEIRIPAGVPPRCFPLRWFRVIDNAEGTKMPNRLLRKYGVPYGPESQPIYSLFEDVRWHPALDVTEFVWGLDRQFSTAAIESARLHYRDSERNAVALGHSYKTPGLVFRLGLGTGSYIYRALVDVLAARDSAPYQALLFHSLRSFVSRYASTTESANGGSVRTVAPSPFVVRDILKVIWFHLLETRLRDDRGSWAFGTDDLINALTPGTPTFLSRARFEEICEMLAPIQDSSGAAVDRAVGLKLMYDKLQNAIYAVSNFNRDFLLSCGTDLLLNSLGIAVESAALRVSGAEDGELRYFYKINGEAAFIFLFDFDEGGNGAVDVIRDHFYISTVEHALEDKKIALGVDDIDPLPDTDFITELENELDECLMGQAAHYAYHGESTAPGIGDDIVASEHRIGGSLYRFLRTALGVESFDNVGVFQQCPEFLAWLSSQMGSDLIPSAEYPTFHALEAACHFCYDGCISCVVAPESNVHGSLMSEWTVSKLLLDCLYRKVVEAAETSALIYPGNGVGRTLSRREIVQCQANSLARPSSPDTYRVQLAADVFTTVQPTLMIGRSRLILRPSLATVARPEERYRLRMRS